MFENGHWYTILDVCRNGMMQINGMEYKWSPGKQTIATILIQILQYMVLQLSSNQVAKL